MPVDEARKVKEERKKQEKLQREVGLRDSARSSLSL